MTEHPSSLPSDHPDCVDYVLMHDRKVIAPIRMRPGGTVGAVLAEALRRLAAGALEIPPGLTVDTLREVISLSVVRLHIDGQPDLM